LTIAITPFMTIEILPARLANQIAAGEVVERPASVVKELVENSLDAGATAIKIDIEKGGAKRIRISDNGCGIVKEELTLALSRHATSKIKNLSDLEGIGSLGFRGEALASISSVARLTLTSKPQVQDTAWQAYAEGRDMEVNIQPAAHAHGTTIDVVDLFFNTPARRKFLRTEKTEFNHIEEVIKRIALARFDVSFTLTHNGKIIRQYRIASNDNQKAKRVAQVCGQTFIDHALMVDCCHDGLRLTGWIAKPTFSRSQNDLCYSYVNGRMMLDKLINHAIRQSYQEMLPSDCYPAFVLFLELDVREVDVNVHPAKHEVRFHQGRYVHDFIYSVCHQALVNHQSDVIAEPKISPVNYDCQANDVAFKHAQQQVQDYVAPLKSVVQPKATYRENSNYQYGSKSITSETSNAYQALLTPHQPQVLEESKPVISKPHRHTQVEQSLLTPKGALTFIAPAFAIFVDDNQPKLLSLAKLERALIVKNISDYWQKGITSQPLLLPIKISFSKETIGFIEANIEYFVHCGIVIQILAKESLQIRQYPAMLRHQDVNQSFTELVSDLQNKVKLKTSIDDADWQASLANRCITSGSYDENAMIDIYHKLAQMFPETINQQLALNSVPVNLTSAIEALS